MRNLEILMVIAVTSTFAALFGAEIPTSNRNESVPPMRAKITRILNAPGITRKEVRFQINRGINHGVKVEDVVEVFSEVGTRIGDAKVVDVEAELATCEYTGQIGVRLIGQGGVVSFSKMAKAEPAHGQNRVRNEDVITGVLEFDAREKNVAVRGSPNGRLMTFHTDDQTTVTSIDGAKMSIDDLDSGRTVTVLFDMDTRYAAKIVCGRPRPQQASPPVAVSRNQVPMRPLVPHPTWLGNGAPAQGLPLTPPSPATNSAHDFQKCTYCANGAGNGKCRGCNGSGFSGGSCGGCNGTGYVNNSDASGKKICRQCNGDAKRRCSHCNGRTTCSACGGVGSK